VIEHATTADMADGRALPPMIGLLWRVVRRTDGRTLWRSGRRGITLRREAKELVGPCPHCGGDDRFAVNTTKKIFNCRGCGAKGDVIALVMFLDGCDFNAARVTLAGEPLPKANGGDRAAAEAKKMVAAEYPYHTENGWRL
jgi:hypothetical protein